MSGEGERRLKNSLAQLRRPDPGPGTPFEVVVLQHLRDIAHRAAWLETYIISRLQASIEAAFTIEELQHVAFTLHLDFEDLEGHSKRRKIQSLIQHLDHAGLPNYSPN